MIRYIEGTVLKGGATSIVVSVGGLGYHIHTTTESASLLSVGAVVSMHTYLAVRENALDLYGFLSSRELDLFELLLTVSGIGPKSALTILSLASVETIVSAVAEQRSAYLTTVGGIGKKTAEKIVLELKEKIHTLTKEHNPIPTDDEDALEALKVMGYSLQEARDALKQVPNTISGGTARLREALRSLAR